jgi:hypothetical protein
VGRPLKKIDPKQVEELAAIQCSYAEMAAVLDCNPSTLQRRFAQAIEKGRERGKSSLKRAQWNKAVNDGNPTMLIWLGKQHLGQSDKTQVDQQSITDTARAIKDALETIDADVLYEH